MATREEQQGQLWGVPGAPLWCRTGDVGSCVRVRKRLLRAAGDPGLACEGARLECWVVGVEEVDGAVHELPREEVERHQRQRRHG